jgi:hypothetical protein
MQNQTQTHGMTHDRRSWRDYLLLVLLVEKIIQHILVTIAFYFNWSDIASTVVISPSLLMILGAVAAMAFGLSFWGMVTQRKWAIDLVILLALFDITGEFIAQGRIPIVLTVSFVVAVILLILALLHRRRETSRVP